MSLHDYEIAEFNRIVTNWTRNSARKMRAGTDASFTWTSPGGESAKGLRVGNLKDSGFIQAAGFLFPRYGVFLEMGVFGGMTREEAESRGKIKPKPWFNPVIDSEVPKLADNLLDLYEDFIIDATRAQIKNTKA